MNNIKAIQVYRLGKKAIAFLLLLSLAHVSLAQNEETAKAFARAKERMRKKVLAGDVSDYTDVGSVLEKYAVANPGNPEAWYFLGYAIDKFNALNGENIINSNLLLAQKASECFRNCIELSDGKYTGEKLLLDPHSKILTVWGGQAMRYYYENKPDSTAWCLEEAHKYGGIDTTVLEFFRQMLDECSENAYLFNVGDLQVYYIAYLQHVLGVRPDVRAINLDYLNTIWYAPLMISRNRMHLTMSPENLNAISDQVWQAKNITVENERYPAVGDSVLSWLVNPSFENTLLRSDFILMHLLQQNKMLGDVFFPSGLPISRRLSLTTGNYLQLRGLTVKLNSYRHSNDINFLRSRLPSLMPLKNSERAFLNNPDNLQTLNVLRFAYAWTAEYALQAADTAFAKGCFIAAEEKYPESLLPFYDDTDKNWYLSLKNKIENL